MDNSGLRFFMMESIDKEMMREAILEASKCDPKLDRIPKVGAIIAIGREVIGRGHRGTGNDGDDDHAEKNALAMVTNRLQLQSATLYTTLEPCTPEVRTNKLDCCLESIKQAEIKRVFLGIVDPNQGVRGKSLWELQERGVDVELFPPDLAKNIRILNAEFVRTQQTLGIQILDPKAGQTLEALTNGGKYIVKGKCLNPPGDNVFAFTSIAGKWWPQPHSLRMTVKRDWEVEVYFGCLGSHTIYILKADKLGVSLVNYYRKCVHMQEERLAKLRGHVNPPQGNSEAEFLQSLAGPYQSIDMGPLPMGLELQAKVEVVVHR